MTDVIEITTPEELDDLLASEDLVVVKFWATWCGPCKKFAPHYEAAAERSDATFVAVDVDKVPDLTVEYNVMQVPTTLAIRGGTVTRLTSSTSVKLLSELSNL